VTGTTPRSEWTLLKALVRERRLTVQETLGVLERRAQQMGERGYALSDRQLRRWLAGDVSSLDGARPANVRVAEAEFGWPIDLLLVADKRPQSRPEWSPRSAEIRELRTNDFISWLASHSALDFEETYRLVAGATDELAVTPPVVRATREHARSQFGRESIAETVAEYYGSSAPFYRARVGGRLLRLSVLTDHDWTGLSLALGGADENCPPPSHRDGPALYLGEHQVRVAVERLAEAEVNDTVMINNPLYRLSGIDIDDSHLSARFECTDFAAYALTADLLETELRDRAPRRLQREPVLMPLRDAWLPTVASGLAFEDRICVGGAVCLVAIADGEQYQLLVQERSNQVVNVTGALAGIPKAFHQPIVDAYGETRISTTVEREMEEELLGRPDLEQRSGVHLPRAAPLHPLNASPPMAWLRAHPDAWRIECTGFGVNMLTGTYEFACLVVIDDPTWWSTFCHLLEANWEAVRLRRYSSLDHDGVLHLMDDPRWSNEGLFAFVEGIRRLGELNSSCVRLPVIERVS